MAKYYVQVAVVHEFLVEASDEFQAERAAYEQSNWKHSIVAMKVYGVADDYDGAGALTGNPIADAAEMRTFETLNREWCEQQAL